MVLTSDRPEKINAEITSVVNEIHGIAEYIHSDATLEDIDGLIDAYQEQIMNLIEQLNYLGQHREKLRREEYTEKKVVEEDLQE